VDSVYGVAVLNDPERIRKTLGIAEADDVVTGLNRNGEVIGRRTQCGRC
jgi:hypothetical protein